MLATMTPTVLASSWAGMQTLTRRARPEGAGREGQRSRELDGAGTGTLRW